MAFVHPEAFWWALLAVPLVLVYLRGERRRPCPVAAGFLWRQAIPAGSARQRWRRVASLAVQAGILLAVGEAMAEPVAGGTARWRWAIVAAIAALAVEWRLFQRRWTC